MNIILRGLSLYPFHLLAIVAVAATTITATDVADDAAAASTAATTAAASSKVVCAYIEMGFANPLDCTPSSRYRTIKVPCVDGPGSPCISDHERLPGISVKDTYCTSEAFHQTVYEGSEKCDDDEATSKDERVFPKNQCTKGILFTSCEEGDCHNHHDESQQEEEEEHRIEDAATFVDDSLSLVSLLADFIVKE